MSEMHRFYIQLTAETANHHPYLSALVKLTQLSRSQVAALKTVLWWSGWHAAD